MKLIDDATAEFPKNLFSRFSRPIIPSDDARLPSITQNVNTYVQKNLAYVKYTY